MTKSERIKLLEIQVEALQKQVKEMVRPEYIDVDGKAGTFNPVFAVTKQSGSM